MKIKNWKDKFAKLKDGTRVRICGVDERGKWILEDPLYGNIWTVEASKVSGAVMISEKDATAEYVEIYETEIEDIDSCFSAWKVGRTDFSMVFKLKKEKIPADEFDRIQKEMRQFFNKFDANLIPYASPFEGGVKVSFLSRIPCSQLD
jgi:uncharacterized pyridoxamine 5'-phosphate oxidase family protein